MERQTIFRPRQGLLPEDFTNLQTYTRNSLDHVVYDGIYSAKAWSDFEVVTSGPAEVTVRPGRLYNAGGVYVAEADNIFDLINDLPLTNKMWVAIVGYGSEIPENEQPRKFLIDPTTRAAEAEAVPMTRLRYANIATIKGVEAPQPVKPTVDSGNTIIAWVLLNATGVESIALNEEARLPQVGRVRELVDALYAWQDSIGPQIDSLRSDLARLFALIKEMGQARFIEQVAIDVARVKEALEIEDDHTDYGADRFLDTGESETEDVNYLAKVEEGIRFSDEAAQLTSLNVFNPVNPDVKISNGFLLPKYTDAKRLEVKPFAEELSISQYSYQSHDMVLKTMSRTRIRYGESVTKCTNSSWWRSGRYDSAKGVFYKDGDTWIVEDDPTRSQAKFKRLTRFWEDTYEVYYWDRIVVPRTIDGQQIGQTFLNGADGWLSAVGLFFTQKGGTGNVDVALCEVRPSGEPDLNAVINTVTLDVADILTSADGTIETKVAFPASFLEAGKRYAIVLTTGGNHYVAMAEGTQYAQGTFFYSVDGAYQQGTFNKDMMFALYFAKFERTRTVVDLAAMSLSGGITDIDILAPMLVPESCTLTFEVQVGGVWHPLESVTDGNTVLYGLPPLLPFRAVFNGTTDVQPGIDMEESVLGYSRPRTTLKHISTEYSLAAATQDLKVIAIIENFYETNHDVDCAILIDGEGSEVAPASVVDVELDPPADPRSPNHKRIKRTWVWTDTEITAPMNSVAIVTNADTSSALDTFHVGERIHLAF